MKHLRACFADNAELPITCSVDIEEPWNCELAQINMARDDCPHWQPERAIKLALDILGVER